MKNFILSLIVILIAQASFAVQKLNLPNLARTKEFLVQGTIQLPKKQKLNKGAPSNITVFEKIDNNWQEVSKINLNEVFTMTEEFSYSFAVHTQNENSPIKIKASLYHCDKVKNNYCVIDDFEGESKRYNNTSKTKLVLNLNPSSPR